MSKEAEGTGHAWSCKIECKGQSNENLQASKWQLQKLKKQSPFTCVVTVT